MKRIICSAMTTLIVVSIVFACGNNKHDEVYSEMVMNSMPIEEENVPVSMNSVQFIPPVLKQYIGTLAAEQDGVAGERPLIKSASLKFKVRDVVNSSCEIETVTLKNKGFILKSSINSAESYSHTVQISSDSSVIIRHYDVKAYLNVRVPQENLHLLLDDIAKEAIYIDYRLLEAKDLTVDMFSNDLETKRMERKKKRMGAAIATRSGKLSDAVDSEETLDAAEKHADEIKLSEFVMQDDLKLSTVSIEIYQNKVVSKEFVKNANDESYKPGFAYQLKQALSAGWDGLQVIFIFMIQAWPLWVVLVAVFIVVRKYRMKKKLKE